VKKITLKLTLKEALLLQTCCEFVEQFSTSANKDQKRFIENYTEGEVTLDELYWFGDKMSFNIARLREKKGISNV